MHKFSFTYTANIIEGKIYSKEADILTKVDIMITKTELFND